MSKTGHSLGSYVVVQHRMECYELVTCFITTGTPGVEQNHMLIPEMPHKIFVNPTIVLTFLSLTLLLYTTSNPPNNDDFRISHHNAVNNKKPPVKVYMYDLPRKFTYGVIDSYAAVRGRKASLIYPGHQYSAEWYLFLDLNQLSHERVDSAVTRVLGPDEADVFYVPFFSSLSHLVTPTQLVKENMSTDGLVYDDKQTQGELMEWLEEQPYWKRNNGWDHVFICQNPKSLNKVIRRVGNGVLLVSCFARLHHNQASLVKDVILPCAHQVNTYDGGVGIHNRESLLFFMRNRYKKGEGKIQGLLFGVLENEKNVVVKHGAQSTESRRAAYHRMHTSRFCLDPAGDTPSSCRLFDAIVSLCIPVIVGDYKNLPFEDVIDYRKIAVFVDTHSAVKPGKLVKLLRGVSSERILQYQRELEKAKRYFEYEDPNGTVKEIWRQVSLKLPFIKLMNNRDKRIVRRHLTEPDCSCLCSNQSGLHVRL